jgi:hypothetical protein
MDFPVLRYIDVLIGFSFVMLLVATVALTISQTLMNMMAARVRHLTSGLEQLIRQLHPELLDAHANYIATLVLRHPLVGRPPGLGARVRGVILSGWHFVMRRDRKVPKTLPGNVIQRGELAFCLLEWAAGDSPLDLPFESSGTVEFRKTLGIKRAIKVLRGTEKAEPAVLPDRAITARAALASALKFRGIEDPLATLRAVKLQALMNEKDKPEQASHLWRSQALAQCAPSDALATIHQYFDATMARVTASFGTEAQLWVSVVALVLVGFLQLDALQLVKRLSMDDKYRDTLVAEAQRLKDKEGAPTVDSLAGTDCETQSTEAAKDQCRIKASLNLLRSPTLDIRPARGWPKWEALPGMLMAWLLVSLGAPFWFDMIKNLFKLRSVLAQKEEGDRGRRDGTTPATEPPPPNAAPPAGPPPPPGAGQQAARGEMGDLSKTGVPA